jgi:hypothetical protein
MNPLTMHLASGESLFSGAGLLLLALLLSPWCRNRWARLIRNLLAWSALVLILGSSTPHPVLVDVFLAALFIGWLAGGSLRPLPASSWPVRSPWWRPWRFPTCGRRSFPRQRGSDCT